MPILRWLWAKIKGKSLPARKVSKRPATPQELEALKRKFAKGETA